MHSQLHRFRGYRTRAVHIDGRGILLLLVAWLGSFAVFAQSPAQFLTLQILTTKNGTDVYFAYDEPRLVDGYLAYAAGEETGITVNLAPNVSRILRNVSFSYYANYSGKANLQWRIYANDGRRVNGFKSPGTLLSESHVDMLGTAAGNVITYNGGFTFSPTNPVPDQITVTLRFGGLDATRSAGWITSEAQPKQGSQPGDILWTSMDDGVTWDLSGLNGQPPTGANVLAGPLTNSVNGHVYYLLADDTWEGSEASAIALGGHLVTLNDSAEQDWVFSQFGSFGGVPRHLWIGLRRYVPGGPLTWVNGERPTFSHWLPSQPAGTSGNELYVHMVKTGNPAGRPPGFWNNLASPVATYPTFDLVSGVVEVQPPPAPEIAASLKSSALTWDADATRSYQVQVAPTPSGPWTNSGTPVKGVGTVSAPLVITPGSAQGFFRVLATP